MPGDVILALYIGTRTGFGMGGSVFVYHKWSRVHFWHAKSGLVGLLFAGTTFGIINRPPNQLVSVALNCY